MILANEVQFASMNADQLHYHVDYLTDLHGKPSLSTVVEWCDSSGFAEKGDDLYIYGDDGHVHYYVHDGVGFKPSQMPYRG